MTKTEWRKEIKKAMFDRDIRMTNLARDLDVSTQWINRVLREPEESSTGAFEEWEKRISDYLGVRLYERG